MAYDFTTLQTEVFQRGLQYLNDAGTDLARVKRALNDAMHMVDQVADWPYRLTSTTGNTSSGLTIADLGTILSVTDVGNDNRLTPANKADLRGWFADLTTTGVAEYFYLVNSIIYSYPVSTATMTVDYFKVGPDLSGGSDTPLMPDRYRYSIVEYAVSRFLREEGDYSGADAAKQAGDLIVGQMRLDLMSQQHQQAMDVVGPVGEDV